MYIYIYIYMYTYLHSSPSRRALAAQGRAQKRTRTFNKGIARGSLSWSGPCPSDNPLINRSSTGHRVLLFGLNIISFFRVSEETSRTFFSALRLSNTTGQGGVWEGRRLVSTTQRGCWEHGVAAAAAAEYNMI